MYVLTVLYVQYVMLCLMSFIDLCSSRLSDEDHSSNLEFTVSDLSVYRPTDSSFILGNSVL